MQKDEFKVAVDLEPYRRGKTCFSSTELEVIGEVDGQRVLVLPGSLEEVLSFLNLGAKVSAPEYPGWTGGAMPADWDGEVETATASALEGVVPEAWQDARFRVVYSPWGSLDWLDDIDRWAEEVARALQPGGRLICYDEHPMAYLFGEADGRLVVEGSYFGSILDEDGDGEPDQEGALGSFGFTLGDLVNALGFHGLAVCRLEEFPESDRFPTPLDRFEGVDSDAKSRVATAMVLVAVKIALS